MKIIALIGAGEFTESMNEVDSFLYKKIKKMPKVIGIISTAAGQEDTFQSWMSRGIQHFAALGIKAIGIPIQSREDAMNDANVALVESCGWIYFSGGDPSYLLATLTGTLVWKSIIQQYNKGCIIAGCSAGAMLLGDFILLNPIAAMKQIPGEFAPALHFVDYMIIPHFDRIGDRFLLLQESIEQSSDAHVQKNFLGIDEDTAFIIQNKKGQVYGKGKCRIIGESSKSTLLAGEEYSF